jgi:hypothetical protein
MKKFLEVLGFAWQSPAILLCWLFYILPLYIAGDIEFVQWESFGVARWNLESKKSWYAKLWRDFWGWYGPGNIIMRNAAHIIDENAHDYWSAHVRNEVIAELKKTLKHELRHHYQGCICGPFYYPIYGVIYLGLKVSGKNAYINHPFEKDARNAENK